MNILFDQTEAQASFYNGAAEYAQTVFLHMLSLLDEYPQVKIYCLYSSERDFRYKRLSFENLKHYSRIIPADYKDTPLKTIIERNKIDLLFITCAQSFCDLHLGDMRNLGCKVVSVIHDLCDEETEHSRLLHFQYMNHPQMLLRMYLSRLKVRLTSGNLQKRSKLMTDMLANNDAEIITVSDYSGKSIQYNYPWLDNRVHVFSAPAKDTGIGTEGIDDPALKSIIDRDERYFLLLSADRVLKNAERTIHAFETFDRMHKKNYKLVTIGWQKKETENHIPLPFLSTGDLEAAYKYCHALIYPSLFEGFGYPPLEAMKYGKPVLSSNVCSMPEVLEKAPIYFSPLYETDIFKALVHFSETSYEELTERCFRQYQKVKNKQDSDLNVLTRALMEGTFITKHK